MSTHPWQRAGVLQSTLVRSVPDAGVAVSRHEELLVNPRGVDWMVSAGFVN